MKKTVAFSRDSINVFFHILTKCNLSCKHCYINPGQHGESTLPLSTINEWLKAFADKSGDANVIFLGGEPTLHPDLSLAVKEARALGYKSITIDTNGYLFHDILSRVTPEEVDFMSFSLDGATRETNDSLRGEGSYDRCLKGIRESVSRGFATSMIYTVSSANIHELELMIPLVKELGISRFFLQVLGMRGNSAEEGQDLRQVTRQTWINDVLPVAEKIAGQGITVTCPKVFLDEDETFECAGVVAENYFIFPNGRVYRCPLCEDFPLHTHVFEDNKLVDTPKINERDLFALNVPEGCVMNKLVQPENLDYDTTGSPVHRIACCLLKQEYSATS